MVLQKLRPVASRRRGWEALAELIALVWFGEGEGPGCDYVRVFGVKGNRGEVLVALAVSCVKL